jgi:hypothetical protein
MRQFYYARMGSSEAQGCVHPRWPHRGGSLVISAFAKVFGRQSRQSTEHMSGTKKRRMRTRVFLELKVTCAQWRGVWAIPVEARGSRVRWAARSTVSGKGSVQKPKHCMFPAGRVVLSDFCLEEK